MSEEQNIVTGDSEPSDERSLPSRAVRREDARRAGQDFVPQPDDPKVPRIRQVLLDFPEALWHDVEVARSIDPRAKDSTTSEYAIYLIIAAIMAIQASRAQAAAAAKAEAEKANLIQPATVIPRALSGVAERLRGLRGPTGRRDG